MVNVQYQYSISTDLEKVRNSVESSTKCPTVLLKADTGADVNLMNSQTFDSIFHDRTVLQPSSLRMEAYGKCSGSARKVPYISRMERESVQTVVLHYQCK